MRVLLLTDGIFPFAMGGMQKHSYYLTKYLTLRGHFVHVAHIAPNVVEVLEKEHPAFRDIDDQLLDFSSFEFETKGKLPGHYVRANKAFSQKLFHYFEAELSDFDLIYAQGFTGYAFVEARSKGKLKTPIATNLHGLEMFQKAASPKVKAEHLLLRGIAKYVTLGSDFNFSFGGKITDILLGMGLERQRILECSIGIDAGWLVEKPKPVSDQRQFLFIGRYERRKGIEELNAALKALIMSGVAKFEFHFIGPIPEKFRLQSESIIYHGQLSDVEKIKEIFRASDVLVCPSYSEGMPTVIMEALATGLAILATDVGAVNQQLQSNGWLLPEASPRLIEDALRQAISASTTELMTMKKESLARAREQYTWDSVIDRKIQLLQQVAKGKSQQ